MHRPIPLDDSPTATDRPTEDAVFLVDVDNTLLDNDRVIADLRLHLARDFGASAERYWAILEQWRAELGYVDYLGALQRYRAELDDRGERAGRLLAVSGFLIDYPFADRLYPQALAALAALRTVGTTAILSDGDVVFQPRKVHRSGLWDAVDGRVMIYVHKEQMLDAVQRQLPARRYVMVDDKERILAAMKAVLGDRLLTVFVRQGHYAHDPGNIGRYPAADRTIERIGELALPDVAGWLGLRAGADAAVGGGAR